GGARRQREAVGAGLAAKVGRSPALRHCARWARICPGNNESGGKRRHGTTGVGNPWLREILIECARAASRSRDTYVKAQYLRLCRRRGDSKAIVAVAHSILVSAYYVLARNEPYTDLALNHFDRLEHPDHQVRRLTRQLESLGHRVTLEPLAA